MPTYLVTGGAGFIGAHLCRRFLNTGDKVICIDNFITSRKENLEFFFSDSNFKFIQADVSENFDISEEVDFVLHFASPASPIDYLKFPIETLRVGAVGTYNALELAKQKGAVFLLASTSEVYGDPLVAVQKEDYWGNVNPIGPRGVYDEAKRFAEAMTMAYYRTHKVDTRIVRIFNTYGPGMRSDDGRAVPTFISQALEDKPLTVFGDGSQTRSFGYVDDTVEGICALISSSMNEPVNIGNPQERSMLELAENIIRRTGSKSCIEFKPLPEDDPKVRCPDIGKAEKSLNWKPRVNLEEGLEHTIEWFRGTTEL